MCCRKESLRDLLPSERVKIRRWFGPNMCRLRDTCFDSALTIRDASSALIAILIYYRTCNETIWFARAVSPRHRNQGLAKALLAALIRSHPHDTIECLSLVPHMHASLRRVGFRKRNQVFVRKPAVST